MKKCSQCGASNPNEARYCMRCAAPLSGDRSREERKVVSLLFCDLVGSTRAAASNDVEDIAKIIRDYQHAARGLIERRGGAVEKFVGDGIFAVFGIPAVREDDAERAVHAALEIAEAAERLAGFDGGSLHLRCGVTTGEVLLQVGVDPASGESFVTGDVANVVSRIQEGAPVDGVVVDAATHALTERSFAYEARPPMTVKGKAEPLDLFIAHAPVGTQGEHSSRDHSAPFVGRIDELLELEGAYEEVVSSGRSSFVTIDGEAGSGKSRLLAELRSRLGSVREPPVWHVGRCLPYGDGVTYWALGELVKSSAGIRESDAPEVVRDKLAASIPPVADRASIQELVLPILGLEGLRAEREERFAAWLRFLNTLAARSPAVLVLEDIHFADESLLGFLRYVAERPQDTRFLVLATMRRELMDRHESDVPAVPAMAGLRVSLGPLSDDEIASLASELLGGVDLSSDLRELVVSRSAGNALYAGEFVRLLRDREMLQTGRRTATLVETAEVPLPGSVQALIAARLDLLALPLKAMIGDASVVGRSFWVSVVAAVSGRPREEVEGAMAELAMRGLVEPVERSTLRGQIEFRFSHILLRDVAYSQLTRRARANKHADVLHWVETGSGERVEDVAEILVYHAERALKLGPPGTPDEELRHTTIRYLRLAAERTLPLDTAGARDYLDRALALAETDDPVRADLMVLAGQAALQGNRLDDAVELLEGAIDALLRRGDPRAAVRAMMPLAFVYEHLGSARGLELADEAVALLEPLPPGPELVGALALKAATKSASGEPGEGLRCADRSLEIAAELGLEAPTMAVGFRGVARVNLGDEEGIEDLRASVQLGTERGESRDAGIAYANLTSLLLPTEGPRAAHEACVRAIEFLDERGLDELALVCRAYDLDPLLDLGRLDDLDALAGETARRAEDAHATYSLIYTRQALARASVLRGRVDDEQASWLEESARVTGAPEDMLAALSAVAIVRAAVGDAASAKALIEEICASKLIGVWNAPPRVPQLVRSAMQMGEQGLAVSLLEAFEPRHRYGYAALDASRALVLEAAGRIPEAIERYRAAVDRWRELGVVPERGLSLLGLGRTLLLEGRDGQAKDALTLAQGLLSGCGAEPALAEVTALLGQSAATVSNGTSRTPSK